MRSMWSWRRKIEPPDYPPSWTAAPEPVDIPQGKEPGFSVLHRPDGAVTFEIPADRAHALWFGAGLVLTVGALAAYAVWLAGRPIPTATWPLGPLTDFVNLAGALLNAMPLVVRECVIVVLGLAAAIPLFLGASWSLRGGEGVELSADALRLRAWDGLLEIAHDYRTSAVSELRLASEPRPPWPWQIESDDEDIKQRDGDWMGWRGWCRLAFDYGASTVRFGGNLEPWEARLLLDAILEFRPELAEARVHTPAPADEGTADSPAAPRGLEPAGDPWP